MTKLTWTLADEDAANNEGWCVSETSEGYDEIQRLDESNIFATDAEAIAHVYWMATAQNELHRKALFYTLREENKAPNPTK
jgi:hypothetical protein